MTWKLAREELPEKSGYYMACVLPSNWRKIEDKEALSYLQSRCGRRMTWFNNRGDFWDVDFPSRSMICINDLVVYWDSFPEAPHSPELLPYLDKNGQFFSSHRPLEYQKELWMQAVARRYFPSVRGKTTAELAEMVISSIIESDSS